VRSSDSCVLKCCFFNAQSIVNKLLKLQSIMYDSDYDCIFIVKSWLHADICDGVLNPCGLYIVIRKDRMGVRGGGICVLVKRTYQVTTILFSDVYKDLEMIGVTLVDFSPKLDVFTVYRPPQCSIDVRQYLATLIDCLKVSTQNSNTHVIVGDLNLPSIDWNTLSCHGSELGNLFLDFVIQYSWTQFVNFPTRCQNTFDLVLADVERVVTHIGQKPPIGRSDHAAVDMMFDLVRAGKHVHKPDTQARYLWHHADYDVMYEYLAGVDWLTMVCHHPEASQSWSTFNRLLTEAVNLAVPIAASCQHRSTKACHSRAVRNCVLQKT